MAKQQELQSSPHSSPFSSPLSSPPESLDGFDSFETYESRRGIPQSPTPKRNARRRPVAVEKLKAQRKTKTSNEETKISQEKTEALQEKTRKPEVLDGPSGREPQKTPSISPPPTKLDQGPTSPEQPKVVEKEDRPDGVDRDGFELPITTSIPPPAREPMVQNSIILEEPAAIEEEDKADKVDVSDGPEVTSPSPPSTREPHKEPPMLEQPDASAMQEVTREPIKVIGPAADQGSVNEINDTIMHEEPAPNLINPEDNRAATDQTSVDKVHDTITYGEPAPKSNNSEVDRPATNQRHIGESQDTIMYEEPPPKPIKAEATPPATDQSSVVAIPATITKGEPAPKSPSPLGDEKKPTVSPLRENETRSPTKRKASGQGRKQPATKNPRRATTVPARPRKTAKQKKWDPPFVITDSKSPLTEADLRAILLLPQAWDILTPDEKRSVLAKFPDGGHILNAGTDDARPDIQSLRNNDNFRHDCARYSENISEGRHDEEWLQQAWVAHEKHRRGDFDDYLEQKFVEDWSTEIPEEYRVRRARQSIDSAGSGSRRVSNATSSMSRGSLSRDGSPVTKTTPENVRTMQKLTLGNSPMPSEAGSPTNMSPTVGTSMEGVILSPSRERD